MDITRRFYLPLDFLYHAGYGTKAEPTHVFVCVLGGFSDRRYHSTGCRYETLVMFSLDDNGVKFLCSQKIGSKLTNVIVHT